jgi:hypothetical protein
VPSFKDCDSRMFTRMLRKDGLRWRGLKESGTLLIFKVKDQGHRVKFLGEGIGHALRCPCLLCIVIPYWYVKRTILHV